MLKLSSEQRINLFKRIKSLGAFDMLKDHEHFMDFLDSVWNLDIIKSTDDRFRTMRHDIIQHCINNPEDYDDETVFLEKLPIDKLKHEEFALFIENVVAPQFYGEGESETQQNMVEGINEALKEYNHSLVITSFDVYNGNPKYTLVINHSDIDAHNILPNQIPFYVGSVYSGKSNREECLQDTPQVPCFFLVPDEWDDFGVKSQFCLFYINEEKIYSKIGLVKIIGELKKEHKGENGYKTKDNIDSEFLNLSLSYCSLGQTETYYNLLKKMFPKSYMSILWALKDCAVFSTIEERFDTSSIFNSLIRETTAQRILREEKYILEGLQRKDIYSFTYLFKPSYSEEYKDLEIHFNPESLIPRRVVGLIGENGVGKTQLISSIPRNIAIKEKQCFKTEIPQFNKIIAISYGVFDHFERPRATATFNYTYCGLQIEDIEGKHIMDMDNQINLLVSLGRLINRDWQKVKNLRLYLSTILSEDFVERWFLSKNNKSQLNIPVLANDFRCLSSGESMLVYVFCSILANIRHDSLILFDEPEIHLHPDAITKLMSALNDLLVDNESFAIIATHSPMIVREIPSSNVFIMDKVGNDTLSIRKLRHETFGTNISIIEQEVFGAQSTQRYYRKRLQYLKEEGYSKEKVLKDIEVEDVNIGLNLLLYINQLFE